MANSNSYDAVIAIAKAHLRRRYPQTRHWYDRLSAAEQHEVLSVALGNTNEFFLDKSPGLSTKMVKTSTVANRLAHEINSLRLQLENQ